MRLNASSLLFRFRPQKSCVAIAAVCLALTLSQSLSVQAQQVSAANKPRITQAVDESKVVTLKGNVSRLATPQNDRGAAAISEPMQHLQLVLQRSPAQEAALRNYLSLVQVKSSPQFHKWLTPEQFGQLYGPADADIQKLTGWLEGRGFKVNKVAKGKITIDFSGSVAQVQDAFQTPIHSFQANGFSFLSNTRDPKIPAAFSAVVSGIAHLNTIKPLPQYIQGKPGQGNAKTHHLSALAARSGVRPQLTVTDSSGNSSLYLTPGDAATIYDTPVQALNVNFGGNAVYDGTGVTIGIAGQSTIDTTAAVNYRTAFLPTYPATAPTIIDVTGVGEDSSFEGESYLDVEIAGGLAPGATIDLYAASDVGTAAQAAIEDNAVAILSVSYGLCEAVLGNSSNAFVNLLWEQAAAQGITVNVASGDNGSAGCDATTDNQGNDIADATGGLAVNGLASTPFNVAVGGTDFYPLAGNFGAYAGSNTSNFTSAFGYIPESTWNDSTQQNGTVSANAPWPVNSTTVTPNIAAGSGGASNCAVQPSDSGQSYTANCTSGYAKPSWQTGTGVPNDTVRDLPDISFFSGDGVDSAAWLVCDNQTSTQNGVTTASNCAPDSNGNFYFDAFGGTSAGTPAFSGIMAQVAQKTGQRQGQAAAILYALANGSNPGAVFNDISGVNGGNNSVPCTQNATNAASCVQNAAGNFFESGFDTNVGYDLATGLGSLDATSLVNNWTNASALLTPVLALNLSPTTVTIAQALTVSVTVTGPSSGSPVPTGSVGLSAGSYSSSTGTPLVNGSATLTVPVGAFSTPGAYLVLVAYQPDSASSSVYYTGSATTVVTVTGTAPAGTLNIASPAPTAATVSSPGQAGSSTITVTPGGGYTGTVNFTCNLATAPTGAATAYNPACSVPALKVTGTAAQTVTAAFTTTAPTSGALAYPETNRSRWYTAAGGAALACVLFFGIPARRRGWRSMLSLMLFLVAMAGVGCGGGGGGNNNNGTPGTTAGTYTYTVVATDSAVSTITSTATITLTVQ